jgi:hypothetical protein
LPEVVDRIFAPDPVALAIWQRYPTTLTVVLGIHDVIDAFGEGM